MDERRRRYYLTALGIDPWCARWPLPGGAPSPECPPDQVGSAEAAKPEVSFRRDPVATQQDHGQRVSLDAVRDALGPQETVEPSEAHAENHSDAPPDTMAGHEVNAMVWHDDRFSLMASAPEGLPSERQNRLGCNILRALGAAGDQEATTLRWPPFHNPELPGNNGDNFQRVIDQLVRSAASGRWIILGTDLHAMVGESFASAGHEVVLKAEQTLGDLLADPAAKRALWEQVQPLVQRGADN